MSVADNVEELIEVQEYRGVDDSLATHVKSLKYKNC
jgi:hypothetical protein